MAINGNSLADALTLLKCNCDKQLDGSSYDWLFENPELKPFLVEFIKAAQFGEINCFDDENTDMCNINDDTRSLADIEKEIQHKKKEIRSKKLLKTEITNQQVLLRKKNEELDKDNLEIEILKGKNLTKFKKEQDRLSQVQKELSGFINSMIIALTEFINATDTPANETIFDDQSKSASLVDADSYLRMEDAFLSSQRGYVDNLFTKQIWAAIEVKNEPLSLDNYENDNITQSAEGYSNFYKWRIELHRLRDSLSSSKENLIRSKTLIDSLKVQISILDEKVSKHVPEQGLDVWQLKLKIEQAKAKQEGLSNKLTSLSKDLLPKEVRKIVNVMLEGLIIVNYSAKQKRQTYFLDKQTRLLQLLLEQQSRLALLHITVQLEAGRQSKFDALLRYTVDYFSHEAQSSQKNCDYIESLKLNEENCAKNLPPPADPASNLLSNILGKNKEELYVSYQSMLIAAKDFCTNCHDLMKSLDKNFTEQDFLTSQLTADFDWLNQRVIPLVFDSTRNLELKQLFGQLEIKVNHLEQTLGTISSSHNEKEKFLKNCEREREKREKLFEKFTQ